MVFAFFVVMFGFLGVFYIILIYIDEIHFFINHIAEQLPALLSGLLWVLLPLMLISLICWSYLVIKEKYSVEKIGLKQELIKIKVGNRGRV